MPGDADLTRQLERYLRHLAIEKGRSGNTVAAYRRDLRPVLDAGVAWEPAALAGYVRGLRERPEPLAASSVTRTISSIRTFSRFLVDEGVLDADPSVDLVAPKQPARLPKALTIEQVEQLLAATDGDEPADLRDKALIELLYATGARISEAVALNVDDLLGEEGMVEVVRLFGKGGKQRIVPVGSYARAALDAYLVRSRPVFSAKGVSTPALFLGVRGARLSRQNAWLLLRAAAERAKLGVVLSPHSMRHSFATHLLQGGADVRVVQELLGHASVATTQIYTRVTADALRDVYVTSHPRAR
jgi:integrase/recombinase XerD